MRHIVYAAVFVGLLSACQPKQVEIDRENCGRLKIGMSRADVVGVMGEPHAQNAAALAKPNLSLHYSEPRLASGPITVHLVNSGSGFRAIVVHG